MRAPPAARRRVRRGGCRARVRVYYAGKAFLCTEMPAGHRPGLDIDVCSGGELAVALRPVSTPPLGFHGNNKSLAEIDRASGSGWARSCRQRRSRSIASPDAARRHGVQPSDADQQRCARLHARVPRDRPRGPEVRHPARRGPRRGRAIRGAGLRSSGLHSHIGSQIFESAGSPRPRALVAVHAELLADGDVPELNLGGGFGIAYTAADVVTPIGQIAAASPRWSPAYAPRSASRSRLSRSSPAGRSSARDGVTLYEVGTTKPVQVVRVATRRYVSVDGGMSDNVRPALYRADYSVRHREPRPRMPTRPWCGSPASTARAATSSCTRTTCRAMSRPGDLARGAGDRRVLLGARQQLQLPRPPGRRRRARWSQPSVDPPPRDRRGSAAARRRCRIRLLRKGKA